MRLMIADDHHLLRDALATHIQRSAPDIEVVGVGSVDDAMGELEKLRPFDLLLLDLRMPGMNGLDGLARIRNGFPMLKVALMSGEAGPEDVRAAMARGARGFVPKTLSGDDLVGAIRQLLSGATFIPDGAVPEGDDDGPANGGFTRREREVLDFLLKGKSNKEIARFLDLEEVTVKLHVRGLCRKLGAKNRTQAAMRAVELGLAR